MAEKSKESWKHCLECDKHWDAERKEYEECPECKGGFEDCLEADPSGHCLQSALEEEALEDMVVVSNYLIGKPVEITETRTVEGEDHEVKYTSRPLSIGKFQASLGSTYAGYTLLGYGWKDDDAKTVLETNPSGKLRVSSGSDWVNTRKGIEKKAVTLTSFKEKFKGANVDAHRWSDVLENFRTCNAEEGWGTVIWDETNGPLPGAEEYVKKLQDFKPKIESYGEKTGGSKKIIEELNKQHDKDQEELERLRALTGGARYI